MTEPRTDLTQERIRELFDYDSENGWLIRKLKSGKTKLCGHKPVCEGYGRVELDYKKYLTHRLVWLWYHGSWPEFIDHIDRDPMNNRIENLRPATRAENNHNRTMNKNNTSGYPGVYFNKQRNKFMAQIVVNGKNINLGYFPTAEEAHTAYMLAKIQYHPSSPIAQEYCKELALAG